jgi:hypothetical protein
MTKDEFPKLIDLVIASWNLQVAGTKRIDMEKAWWRYLKDIPYDAAVRAIDKLVVRDGPPPRVGAVRRLAMEDNPLIKLPPEPTEAWAQAREFASSLDAGIVSDRVPTVHPLVLTAIRAGIREYRPFVEFYTNKLQEWRDQTFGIK